MADVRPRCECLVKRAFGFEEVDLRSEPCGRLAKTVIRVGKRDVPACWVHAKVLARGIGVS